MTDNDNDTKSTFDKQLEEFYNKGVLYGALSTKIALAKTFLNMASTKNNYFASEVAKIILEFTESQNNLSDKTTKET